MQRQQKNMDKSPRPRTATMMTANTVGSNFSTAPSAAAGLAMAKSKIRPVRNPNFMESIFPEIRIGILLPKLF